MKRIDVLPDDVLLKIFDSYMIIMDSSCRRTEEAWKLLVHVCRRWRILVFGSPRHLNLRLHCTPQTPVKDKLDIWPALPLIIEATPAFLSSTENIIAALGQRNRVCEIELYLADWQSKEVLAAMQVSFPELTVLKLCSYQQLFSLHETPSVIPDSFLGGSAPRLRSLDLDSISFPGLPKLLLSTTQLVHLSLECIPHSGYISPEAMVALLSVLSSLKSLILHFQSPESRPDRESQRMPLQKRSILPVLAKFRFHGDTEYLQELVTRIDTPRLNELEITFFNPIGFDYLRLVQFINCIPTLRALDEAHLLFHHLTASVILRSRTTKCSFYDVILCSEPDRLISSIKQVCSSPLNFLSTVEDLYIERRYWRLAWENDIEDSLWLELLLPFTVVKGLYLSKKFALAIAASLQELVGGRITEVLPSLQNIFVEDLEPSGPFQENIGQFFAARRLSGHPIVISVWDCVSYRDSMQAFIEYDD